MSGPAPRIDRGPTRPKSRDDVHLRRLDVVIAFVLSATAWVLIWQRVVPDVVGLYNDDGVYVVTAKAMATGHGYRLLHLPGEPLQTKYPPLYPAMLAAIWWVRPEFPGNVVLMKAAGVLFAGIGVGLAYLFLVRFRYADRSAAAIGVAAGLSTPHLLHVLALTMSETLFIPLLIAALWASERATEIERRASVGFELASGFVLAAMMLTRSIGVFIGTGITLSLLWRRRASPIALVCAWAPVLAWHAWAAWSSTGQGSLTDAYNASYVSWWYTLAPAAVAQVIGANLGSLVRSVAHFCFEGLLAQVEWLRVPFGVVWLAAAALWAGVVGALGLRGRPLSLALAVYMAAVIVWPWPPLRFLLPMLPLLFGLALGWPLGWPGTAAARVAIRTVVLGVGLLVAVTNAMSSWPAGRLERETGYPMDPIPTPAPRWHDMQLVLDAVRARTGADSVVAGVVDPMIYLYTGRHAVQSYELDAVDLFYGEARHLTAGSVRSHLDAVGATHMVLNPMPFWPGDAVVRTWQAQHPGELEAIYAAPDPRFVLFGIHRVRP